MLCPPAAKKPYKFYFFWEGPHTHPAHENKGWVCMGNSTRHDMNQGNPEVRPTTKVHENRTKEEGNTAGTPNNCTAATKPSRNTTSSPHTHRTKAPENSKTKEHQRAKPDRQTAGAQQPSKDRQTDQPVSFTFQRKKEKRKRKEKQSQQNHHGTVSLSWTCANWLKGSRPCSVQVRLVTAVSLTSNWCTSVPYQKPKRSSEACRPNTFTTLSVLYVWHGVIGQLEVRMFQHFTAFDTMHHIRIQEGRTQREGGEEAIELIQPASIWEVRECTSKMAGRSAGP